MREILFRGKRVDNGEWVSGRSLLTVLQDNNYLYYIPQQGEDFKANPSIDNDRILSELFGNFYQVDPKTIGQYTGLTDENGKKIFEGDIIERYERGITEPHNLYPTEKAKVGWNNAFTEFRANIIDLYHEEENLGEFIQGCEIEVIGNIHDNPELLEVE